MVHPVMEKARRKLVQKLVYRTLVKEKKKRPPPSQSTNHVMPYVDPQAKKRAWRDMMSQHSHGMIRARHPRVLTLELQRKEKAHKPRGTPPRISNHSQGEFVRRSTREPPPRNPLDPPRDHLIAVTRSELVDEDNDDVIFIECDPE